MKNCFPFLLQDWSANQGNLRHQLLLLLFRLCQVFDRFPFPGRWLGAPFFALYQFLVIGIWGIELPYKITAGQGLRLYHGVATVLHEKVVLGNHVTLRHATTIGMRREGEQVPVIGDHVDIGCNALILGPIHIGEGAVIGAGAVVFHDVPAGAVAVGNPAKICFKKKARETSIKENPEIAKEAEKKKEAGSSF